MGRFLSKGARPPLRELPGLGRLAVRVAIGHLGGRPTAGTMCILVRPDGRVAFVKASYRAKWSMPGGYCDRNEDPALGVAREVKEETGLLLTTTPRLIASRDVGHRMDYFFVASVDPDTGTEPTTAWEISDFRWATWTERPTLDNACAFVERATPGGVEEHIRKEVARATGNCATMDPCD